MEELSAAEEVGRLVRGRGDRLESSGQAEVKMVPFASARLTVEEDPEQGFLVFGVILNAPDIREVSDRENLQIDLGSMVVEPFPDLSDGVRDPTGGEYGDAGVADFTIAHEESLRDNAERRPESGEEVHETMWNCRSELGALATVRPGWTWNGCVVIFLPKPAREGLRRQTEKVGRPVSLV